MKLLYITHAFPRLHNTFVVQEILGFIENGVELSLLSLDRPFSKEDENTQTPEVLRRRVVYLDDFKESEKNYPECDDLTTKMTNKRRYLEALFRWVREKDFDFVYGAFGNRPAEVGLLLKQQFGLPFAFNCYSYDLFVDFPFEKEKVEEANAIFTATDYNRKYLVNEVGTDPKKVFRSQISIPTELFDEPPPSLSERDSSLIMSACRLHAIKGIDVALKAFARLCRNKPMLCFEIFGDGPERESLEVLAEKLGITANVVFHGNVRSAEIFDAMRRASVFVLPCRVTSDGDCDGFPTVLAEAMALGLPIVTTSVNGILENIQDGENGLIVVGEDVENVSKVLGSLLEDREQQLYLSRNAQVVSKTAFNRTQNVREIIRHLVTVAS